MQLPLERPWLGEGKWMGMTKGLWLHAPPACVPGVRTRGQLFVQFIGGGHGSLTAV